MRDIVQIMYSNNPKPMVTVFNDRLAAALDAEIRSLHIKGHAIIDDPGWEAVLSKYHDCGETVDFIDWEQ